MPSAKNISTVHRLKEQLVQAKALILADYRGLSVADIQKLRSQIRAAGGTLTVAKNRLLKIVLPRGFEDALQGPTALILALEDALAPIKALVNFAAAHALNLPTPKAGLLNHKVLTPDQIKSLAALPSRDQLIAQLLRQLQAQLRQLVYVLTAVKSKKEVN